MYSDRSGGESASSEMAGSAPSQVHATLDYFMFDSFLGHAIYGREIASGMHSGHVEVGNNVSTLPRE